MNRIELFKTLRKHISLSEKRSPVYDQNRTAKTIIYIMSGFMIVYMIFLGIILSLAANGTRMATPCEFLFVLMPFILVLDFFVRFLGQQTPSQLIKPYLMLPIPKYACIESFLLRSILSTNNLLWLFITVPYVIISVLFCYGFWASLGLLLGFQLIISVNSQNYMLWRTMIIRSVLWWAIPIIIYSALFLPWIIGGFDSQAAFYGPIGEWLANWNPICWITCLALLALFFYVNRWIQYKYTRAETSGDGEKQLKNVSQFAFLNRYGEIGEYMKLEIKSVMRNKNMRASFIYSSLFTIFLSVIISYTDIYDGAFTSKFFIVYAFIINGGMLLIKVMGAEGNYIDGLMTHKENILQLLRAKYYFYCLLLFLPFLIMLPTVFAGKYTLLMFVAMAVFTAGPIFWMLMQMAVYNKQTIPLNSKLVGRGNADTNWFAFAAEMLSMFAPVALIGILSLFMSQTSTYLVMFSIGLLFVFTHKLWLRNIYNRFMVRRYENMESFRSTR